MSPSNFAMTNPQVVKATVESKGENLVKGLQNLLTDLERGKGSSRIRQTDMKAFEVGDNVATSPGKVVYQNELMQLIQYAPATEQVYHAAADRAAVDQQVLHSRSQARELVHQVGDRAGLHGVRDLVGQSRRAAHATWCSRTT